MKVLNVVMLGFLCRYTGMVKLESAEAMVLKHLAKKPQFIELNKQAFAAGVEAAEKLL